MSYIYLQEQGEASSADCFSDISQFVQSKLNHTVEKSFCKDSETESCRGFQSGMMFAPSTENLGRGLQKSSAAGFRAKTLVLAEKVQVLRAHVRDFGRKCGVSFAKLNQDSFSWRTHQCLLFGGWELYSEGWPKWGFMQDGECWGQTIPAVLISENESGYLDSTPTKVMPVETDLASERIRILPSGRPRKISKKGTDGSMNWAQLMLHKGYLPTAMLCEYYMGWPIGWTDCKPLAMDKYQSWLQQHGRF